MTATAPYRVPGAPALALDLAGDGSGGLVLFMHGIGGNRSNWRRQLPDLRSTSVLRRLG